MLWDQVLYLDTINFMIYVGFVTLLQIEIDWDKVRRKRIVRFLLIYCGIFSDMCDNSD